MSTKYLKKSKLTNYQQVNNKVYVNKREEICFNTYVLIHSILNIVQKRHIRK